MAGSAGYPLLDFASISDSNDCTVAWCPSVTTLSIFTPKTKNCFVFWHDLYQLLPELDSRNAAPHLANCFRIDMHSISSTNATVQSSPFSAAKYSAVTFQIVPRYFRSIVMSSRPLFISFQTAQCNSEFPNKSFLSTAASDCRQHQINCLFFRTHQRRRPRNTYSIGVRTFFLKQPKQHLDSS